MIVTGVGVQITEVGSHFGDQDLSQGSPESRFFALDHGFDQVGSHFSWSGLRFWSRFFGGQEKSSPWGFPGKAGRSCRSESFAPSEAWHVLSPREDPSNEVSK